MPRPKNSVSSLFAAIFGTVGFSVLAGVLSTVMVAPAIALTGITANNTIGIFESLPEYIVLNAGHQQNEIVAIDKNGNQYHIATIFDQNREEVDLDQMSDYLKWAAIAGEDRRRRRADDGKPHVGGGGDALPHSVRIRKGGKSDGECANDREPAKRAQRRRAQPLHRLEIGAEAPDQRFMTGGHVFVTPCARACRAEP